MKRMKRIGSLLLTLVFVLCMIPAAALPVWGQDVSGIVYASSLSEGVGLDASENLTLIMDVDRTFAYISGKYKVSIEGSGTLTVEGAVDVGTLDVSLSGGDFHVADGVRARADYIALSGNFIDVQSSQNFAIWADDGSVTITATKLAAICEGSGKGEGVGGKGDVHITVSNTAGILGYDYGVYSAEGNITLDGGGTYTIGATGSSGSYDYDTNIGVYAAEGNINLCGNFTVISDKGHAIHAEQGEIVAEGSLDAQASTKNEVNLRTIYAQKGFSFYGTTLNVTGTGGIIASQNGVSITADSTTIITEDNAAIWCYDVPVYIDSDYLWVQNKNEFEGSSNQNIRSTDLTIYSDDATIVGEDGLRCLGDVVLRGNFAISGYGQAYLAIQAYNLDVEGSLTAVGNSQYYPAINVDGEFRFVGETLSVSGKNTGVSAGSLYAEATQATIAGETGIWVGGDATLKGDFTVVGTADMAIKAHEDSDVYVEGSLLFSGKNGEENYWYAIDAKNFTFNGTTLAGTGDGGIRGSESISITAQTVDIEADYDRALSSPVVRIDSDQVRLVSNGLDVEENDIGIYRAALYYNTELTMNVTDAYICGCRGIDSWANDGVATIDGNVTVVGTKSNAITVYGAMTASGSLTLRSEKEYKESIASAAIYAHTFTFNGDALVVESVSRGIWSFEGPLNISAKNVTILTAENYAIEAVTVILDADRANIYGKGAIYAQDWVQLSGSNVVLQSIDSSRSGIWCEKGSVLLSGNVAIETAGWYGINAAGNVGFDPGYYKITGPKGNAQAVKLGEGFDLYVHSGLQIAKPDGGHINGNVINGAGDSPAMELLMYSAVGTVDIYVSTPSDGQAVIFDSSAVYGLPMLAYFDSIRWFENGVEMEDGDLFTAGNRYSIELILSAEEGYYFAESVLAKVNDKNSSMTGLMGGNTQLMIRADLGTCKTAISEVALDVTAPVDGNKPSTGVSAPDGAHYGVKSSNVTWFVSDDGINYTAMAAGAKFVGGKYYRVQMDVTPSNSNYSFKITTADGTLQPDVTAFVGGNVAKVSKAYDQDPEQVVTVIYDFGICNDMYIESITIVDVVRPVAGEHPSYAANASGTGYRIDSSKNSYYDAYWVGEKWYYIKNGISWWDVTDGDYDYVYENDVFLPGHEYKCEIFVVTESGYEFVMDLYTEPETWPNATINGNHADVKKEGGGLLWNQEVSYTFSCLPTIMDTIIVNGIDTPKEGNTPDYTASAAYPQYYQVESLDWFDCAGEWVAPDSRFGDAAPYCIALRIVPTQIEGVDLVEFPGDVTVYIDGKPVTAYGTWDEVVVEDGGVTVYYTFRNGNSTPEEQVYSLSGTVSVSGATVTLMQGDNAVGTVTSAPAYRFDNLSMGIYTLQVSKSGYEIYETTVFITASDVVKDVTLVEISSGHIPGDVNEDGKVNIRDLGLVQQSLNGWNVTLNTDAADVNRDGKINIRDLGLIQQYLNGWNVELQ